MEKYSVYRHTCPNGKVYIGITRNSVKTRWNSGYGYRNNPHFFNAIKKYGWDNIQHEVLAENLTKKEACDYERLLIFISNSTDREFGYNSQSGGEVGTTHSKEVRQHLSDIGKTKTGVLNNFYGHKHSISSKQKMSLAKKNNPKTILNAKIGGEAMGTIKRKAVLQYDLNGNLLAEYPSTVEANLYVTNGKSKFGHIADVCNGKRKTYLGYAWKYKGVEV